MLAARRKIGQSLPQDGRTPLVVPAFSSRSDTGWLVQDTVQQMAESITETALVSLYDIERGLLEQPTFARLLFVDSGGYEILREVRDRESLGSPAAAEPWSEERYLAARAKLSVNVPTIVVSYDHPNDRRSVERQIEGAMPVLENGMVGELLLKPPAGNREIDLALLLSNIDKLAEFPIIGLTDKEIGRTMDDRLRLIAGLRRAFEERGHQTPIHIFGSLDPVTAPLYFLAGADVFDGLSWLRYALEDVGAFYMQSHLAARGMFSGSFESSQNKTWLNNLTFLGQLQERMRAFLSDRNFEVFGPHQDLFRTKAKWLDEAVAG